MYIVFEGIDGTGKSTQIRLVKERLEKTFKNNDYEIPVVTLAEPEISDFVDENDPVEMTLRFALQRRLILNKFPYRQFLENNPTIVMSDRSYYSSLAYQNVLKIRLPDNYVLDVNSFVFKPSLVFFFDKHKGDSQYLENVRNEYFKVLPLSTIYVDTKNHSISQTTNYITKMILKKWNELFESKYNEWSI